MSVRRPAPPSQKEEYGAARARPFVRSLPMQLLRAREAVMQRFRPHLRAHGLTDQQWRVLRALAEAPSLEILEISERCCILPASLSLMLPKLEDGGLISRESNPADQRRVIVSLTKGGRELFAEMRAESEEIYGQLARDIGGERMTALYDLLEVVIASLSAASPRRRR